MPSTARIHVQAHLLGANSLIQKDTPHYTHIAVCRTRHVILCYTPVFIVNIFADLYYCIIFLFARAFIVLWPTMIASHPEAEIVMPVFTCQKGIMSRLSVNTILEQECWPFSRLILFDYSLSSKPSLRDLLVEVSFRHRGRPYSSSMKSESALQHTRDACKNKIRTPQKILCPKQTSLPKY